MTLHLMDVPSAADGFGYRAHNRNYALTAMLAPKERVSLDLAYNYNDFQQRAFICFNDSNTTLSVVANAGSCLANGYNDEGNSLLADGSYTSGTHYTASAFSPPGLTTISTAPAIVGEG